MSMARPAPAPPARPSPEPPGPFKAAHIRPGDPYEISNGHAIRVMPGGERHGTGSGLGFGVIDSDPAVAGAGVDVGFSPRPDLLRAPDVAVTPGTDAEGFLGAFPPLAIEYAGKYQRESDLQEKIADMLGAGTRHLWVVRIGRERCVEVYEPGLPMWVARAGDVLSAPGVLENPVPAEALWDRDAAHEHTLRNLMQRKGYADLDAALARAEARGEARGEALGLASALLTVLEARGIALTPPQREAVRVTEDPATLQRWLRDALEGRFEPPHTA